MPAAGQQHLALVDSGCSLHIMNQSENLINICECGKHIKVANSQVVTARLCCDMPVKVLDLDYVHHYVVF
eukprot:338354-Rhodomonas_salina.1